MIDVDLIETNRLNADRTDTVIPVGRNQQTEIVVIRIDVNDVGDHPLERIEKVMTHLIVSQITKVDQFEANMFYEQQKLWRQRTHVLLHSCGWF